MLVLAALQSWRDDEASTPVERLCWCWSGSRSFHGWRWQLSKAGAVVVPSMAGAMMKQARPLSGGAGAGGRSFHGWRWQLSKAGAMMKQARPLSRGAGGRSSHGRRDDAAGTAKDLFKVGSLNT